MFVELALHDSRTLTRHLRGPDGMAGAGRQATTDGPGFAVHRGWRRRGGFAILARQRGLETVIATCSAGNAEYVAGSGAGHVIDYQRENMHEGVMVSCRVPDD